MAAKPHIEKSKNMSIVKRQQIININFFFQRSFLEKSDEVE